LICLDEGFANLLSPNSTSTPLATSTFSFTTVALSISTDCMHFNLPKLIDLIHLYTLNQLKRVIELHGLSNSILSKSGVNLIGSCLSRLLSDYLPFDAGKTTPRVSSLAATS
jgi:hypothetical protein